LVISGKKLDNGLRVLHDDNVCQLMSDCITGNNIADVFVESMAMQLEAFADDERSDGEANEIVDEMRDRELISVVDDSSNEVQFIGEKKMASI
jgi:alpha-galactosidase